MATLRKPLVVAHRYLGLVMALFLVSAGLTGSILVWYDELDRLAWPVLREVTPPTSDAQPLDPIELQRHVLATIPDARAERVSFPTPEDQGYPVRFGIKSLNAKSKSLFDSPPRGEIYVNPYTGEETGRRNWGELNEGLKNLMPFIFRLHRSLLLGTFGTYFLGVIALLWTLDCFFGLYLTFPRGKPFWQKWRAAWGIKRSRAIYDTHRAGGLWPWAILLVMAWSSVAFNLQAVYSPVTQTVFDLRQHWDELPNLPTPLASPRLNMTEALLRGQELVKQEATRMDFLFLRENSLQYIPAKGLYRFGFTSNHDIRNDGGASQLWFDGNTGALVKTALPTGQNSGNTVTHWLNSFHMARIWGLPLRIFICGLGLAVAILSVTGVIIWWRKRKATNSREPKFAMEVTQKLPQEIMDI